MYPLEHVKATTKPILSYYGGKQRMAPKIVAMMPRHMMYVEPFFGGGAVLFRKGLPDVTNGDYYHEVINDKSELLINFYRIFQSNFPELYHRILYTPHSEAEHKRSGDMLKDPDKYSDIDLAWAYYVNLSQAFANILHGGWARTRTPPARNFGQTWHRQKQRLLATFERLQYVTISCADALKVIEQRDSEDAFFYLDPPYPGTECGHYEGYTLKDLQDLVDLLATIKGRFILSNYPQPDLRVPEDWKIFNFAACRTVGKIGKSTEVIWCNYDPEKAELYSQKLRLL
jgi:DNA adenine methylase